jgi:hypothetical protein
MGMKEFACVTTTRYSAFFTRVFQYYCRDIQVKIDGKCFSEQDLSWLRSSWCTNARIQHTQDFTLVFHDKSIMGFHDHPENLWVASSERKFLQHLAEERLIRFRVYQQKTPDKSWIFRIVDSIITARRIRHHERLDRLRREANTAFWNKAYGQAAKCYEIVAKSLQITEIEHKKWEYARKKTLNDK